MTREGEHQKYRLDAKGQHNVLHQHLCCRTRQAHEGRNLAQVIVHQGHVGGFNSGICARRSHCKANVRTRQGRCVVDAITDHANLAVSGQLLHFAQFVVGQLVALRAVNAGLCGDGLCRVGVIAGQHHGVDAQSMQLGDGSLAAVLDGVRNGE